MLAPFLLPFTQPLFPLFEEAAGITTKEESVRMYEQAISEPHGFLTIRLDGEPGQTFFSKFGENLQQQEPSALEPPAPLYDARPTHEPHRRSAPLGEQQPVPNSSPSQPPAPRGGYGAARR